MRAKILAVALLCVAGIAPAHTQILNPVTPLDGGTPVGSGNPLHVTGTFSATLSGFTPNGNFATITSAGTSGSVALPAGTTVAFQNTGTTTVSCTLGIGSATALASEIIVQAASTVFVTPGSNTWGACIDQTGSTSNTVVLAGGSGLGTGFGGGGGGSGSSGAVYGPTAGGSAAANPPVLIGGTVDGTTTGNVDNWKISSGLGYVSSVLPSASVASGAFSSGSIGSGAVASGAVASGAIATGAFASGSIGSGALASGSVASGAVASGAIAAGALASGAGVDGWDVTQGTKSDAACASGATTPCSVEARLAHIETLAAGAIPVTVNGSAAALTGLTPGSAQTGTIVAANTDATSMGGVAYGAMANYGTSPGAVKVPGVNSFMTSGNLTQWGGTNVLSGTGAQAAGSPRVTVATDQATNAGAALVKGGVGVVNGGSTYNTVAASQSTQALTGGGGGATGDYLSHCVIQPTTTGAGTVTILDNAVTVFTFTTGTLSNLAPIAVPIGSLSVSGAWKVTTGASETVTCFGKFT